MNYLKSYGLINFQYVVLINFLANETNLTIFYKVDIESSGKWEDSVI